MGEIVIRNTFTARSWGLKLSRVLKSVASKGSPGSIVDFKKSEDDFINVEVEFDAKDSFQIARIYFHLCVHSPGAFVVGFRFASTLYCSTWLARRALLLTTTTPSF
jgi:hypothetical protein